MEPMRIKMPHLFHVLLCIHAYSIPNETVQITLYLFTMLSQFHTIYAIYQKVFSNIFSFQPASSFVWRNILNGVFDVFFLSLVWYALCHFILYAFCILPLYIRNAYTIQLLQLKIKLRQCQGDDGFVYVHVSNLPFSFSCKLSHENASILFVMGSSCLYCFKCFVV